MRKLKLQMQTSIDGFVSTGPDDEQQWVTWAMDEIKGHVLDLLDSSDTIIIGRKLAEGYIPYWEGVVTRPDDPMYDIGRRIVGAKKIVFTNTISKSLWPNTEVAKGLLADEVRKLKKENGKDIMVYGGSSFVASLIKEGLIDEFHFFVNPVALGKGEPIFNRVENWKKLVLKKCIPYTSGIVMLNYESQ